LLLYYTLTALDSHARHTAVFVKLMTQLVQKLRSQRFDALHS